MEDLAGKIAELLGNPEIMNQIKELTGQPDSLNSSNSDESDKSDESCKEDTEENTDFSAELIQTFLKLGPFLSSLKKEDKYIRFLKALKPLLSETRQKKLDGSYQILQLIKFLPLLKDKGLF